MAGRWRRRRQENEGDGSGPDAGPGAAGDGGDDEYARLVERSEHALRAKTAGHSAAWGLDRCASWAVDQAAGTIEFVCDDGTVATAPVQIVGSLDTQLGTWLWGWDHPSVRPPLRVHAERVRAHGEEHGIAELTTLEAPADEARAWRFAALACELNDAQGAYRGPAGSVLTFMTFGSVQLHRDPAAEPPSSPADPSGVVVTDDPEAQAWVQGWLAEIHAIESAFDRSHDDTHVERVLQAVTEMEAVYERYWRRDDDYWRPGGLGPGDEHDVERTSGWTTRRLGDDLWRVSYRLRISNKIELDEAFDVRRFPDGLRIVDRHL